MIFVLLSVDSLILSLSVRSFTKPLWRSDIFSNRALSLAVILGLLLTGAALYLAPLRALLHTVALSAPALLLIAFISGIEILLIEGYKKIYFVKQA